ncbi:MAG TPA: tRNA pseudouridine(38-40) synthase TruA [Kiritimatiellia bacterium]|nr:tRNA pseudouridine(38-40) synthase TruA [Kiritimatiellia bacterium]
MKPGKLQRFKIIVGYDGTSYSGWQLQPDKRTVQGELERSLFELSGQQIRVNSSGRTDRGVHARAQVAHFDLASDIKPDKLVIGMNRFIEHDIRVLKASCARPDFDARMSATGKEYRYFIWNERIIPPHLRLYNTHIYRPLNLDAMMKAADHLVGRHDFAAFSANPGHEREGTVRSVFKLKWIKRGPQYTLIAIGDGFLFKMVRSLAGFMVRVGQGDLKPGDAVTILHSKVRTARVPTADPHGLFLWRVFYGKVPGKTEENR